jgi:sodium transport system permease protein
MIAMLTGTKLTNALALIPVVNVALLFKDMDRYTHPALCPFFSHIFSTFLYAFFAIWLTVKVLSTEDVMLSDEKETFMSYIFKKSKSKKRTGLRFDKSIGSGDSILLFVIVVILMAFVGSLWQSMDILLGLIKTELFLILIPPILYLRLKKKSLFDLFGLFAPTLWQFLLTTIMAFSGFVVVQQLSTWLAGFANIPEAYSGFMGDFFMKLGSLPWWGGLLIIALLPAICEEVLFRGFILKD